MTVTSMPRENLFPLIEQVNDDRTPIEITSRRGDAVLLARGLPGPWRKQRTWSRSARLISANSVSWPRGPCGVPPG